MLHQMDPTTLDLLKSMSSTEGTGMAKPKQGVETAQFGGTLLILAMCKDGIYLWFISIDP